MLKKSMMLPVLAVIVGAAASAFTVVNTNSQSQGNDPSYYWFDPSAQVYHDQATVADEISITGCTSTAPQPCENGYTQDQLNNPNNPSQGVKADQQGSPAEQLRKID
jgi:hypothetical protein